MVDWKQSLKEIGWILLNCIGTVALAHNNQMKRVKKSIRT